jgi:hypothetical protein
MKSKPTTKALRLTQRDTTIWQLSFPQHCSAFVIIVTAVREHRAVEVPKDALPALEYSPSIYCLALDCLREIVAQRAGFWH